MASAVSANGNPSLWVSVASWGIEIDPKNCLISHSAISSVWPIVWAASICAMRMIVALAAAMPGAAVSVTPGVLLWVESHSRHSPLRRASKSLIIVQPIAMALKSPLLFFLPTLTLC